MTIRRLRALAICYWQVVCIRLGHLLRVKGSQSGLCHPRDSVFVCEIQRGGEKHFS